MLAPRAGEIVRTAPLLRWRPVRKAHFYNMQLYRRGHKMLTLWPTRSRPRLHAHWTFRSYAYQLKPGIYTWLVWPAYGTLSNPR
ncbi:MAG: hypothetical protein ABI896_05365 [Actinomycetota bacterium]